MHPTSISTAQLHLLIAALLALTAGTYGVVTAAVVVAVLVTRYAVRQGLARHGQAGPGLTQRGLTRHTQEVTR